jgi:hypothetical protein
MSKFVVRGDVEFELCAEGGHYVVRRTERKGGRVVMTETARGRRRDAEAVWLKIINNPP